MYVAECVSCVVCVVCVVCVASHRALVTEDAWEEVLSRMEGTGATEAVCTRERPEAVGGSLSPQPLPQAEEEEEEEQRDTMPQPKEEDQEEEDDVRTRKGRRAEAVDEEDGMRPEHKPRPARPMEALQQGDVGGLGLNGLKDGWDAGRIGGLLSELDRTAALVFDDEADISCPNCDVQLLLDKEVKEAGRSIASQASHESSSNTDAHTLFQQVSPPLSPPHSPSPSPSLCTLHSRSLARARSLSLALSLSLPPSIPPSLPPSLPLGLLGEVEGGDCSSSRGWASTSKARAR